MHAHRSSCPINLALELLGDRWTLLVLRDLMFANKRHFREFLRSEEGISSNILAERLHGLVSAGLLTKTENPSHKQKAFYSLTPMGIDLLPTLAHLGAWSRKYLPVTRESAAQAAKLEKGGPELWREMQATLRKTHAVQ